MPVGGKSEKLDWSDIPDEASNSSVNINVPNFKEEIASHESKGSGDYDAENDASSAKGRYQFLWGTFGDRIKKETGVKDYDEFLSNHEAQDKFFENYTNHDVIPWVQQMKESGNTRGLSDKQLGQLYHFIGAPNAEKYLRTGHYHVPGKNVSINDYLKEQNPQGQQLDWSDIPDEADPQKKSPDVSADGLANSSQAGQNGVSANNTNSEPQLNGANANQAQSPQQASAANPLNIQYSNPSNQGAILSTGVNVTPAQVNTPIQSPSAPQSNLWQANKAGYADSVLNANKNLDWVKRLHDHNAPSIQVPGEPYRSTHLMSDDGNGYVFPSVVRGKDGNLTYLGDKAEDYARETNTGIQLPKEQGSWFAANGYKWAPGVMNTIDENGKPANNPRFAADEQTKSAVETIAKDYLDNQHQHPQEMQDAFQNNPIDHPDNSLNQITNPNGDPVYTGQYFKNRQQQLEKEKQDAINSAGYNDPSKSAGLNPNGITGINNQYNKKIADLHNASNYLISQQLFKKEYENKPLTDEEATTKLATLEKQRDDQIKTANLQINEDVKSDQYKTDINAADEKRKTTIAKANEDFQAATNQVKSQVKWDGVRLGIEQKKLMGDPQAAQDAINYDAGKPISPARKYQYQLSGNEIKKIGVENSTDQAAKEGDKHIDSDKKIEHDNIDYLKGEWVNKIGNAKYNDENPLIHALIPHFGSMSPEDVKKYGKQAGLKPSQIEQVDPSEVPTSATLYSQAAKGLLNTAAPIYEQSVRGIAALTGGDQEAVNNHFQPGWENQHGLGAAIMGNVPSDQNSFHNLRGAAGQVLEGAAGLATFTGEIGAATKAIEATGLVSKAETAEKLANFGVMAFNGYNSAYKNANEELGNKPEDEWKRQTYALTRGLIEGAIFSISPASKLIKNALGEEEKGGEQLLDEIKNAKGAEVLQSPEFKEGIAKKIIAVAAENGKQVSLSSANEMAKGIINTVTDPGKKQDISEDVKQNAISTSLAMLLPSILGGVGHANNETKLNEGALFELGTNPDKYTNFISGQLSEGKINQQQASQMHDAIVTMKNVISQTPTADIAGKPLTPDQIKAYSFSMFQEHLLEQKVNSLTEGAKQAGNIPVDKAQLEPLNKRISQLQKQRADILKDAGEGRPPVPINAIPEQANSEPEEERSVAPGAESEEKTSAAKKSSEKEENNKGTTISLQNNETENEKQTIINQNGRQIGPSESETPGSRQNPDLRQAANLEGGQNPENGPLKEIKPDTEQKAAPTEQPLSVTGKRRKLIVDVPEEIPTPTKNNSYAAWDQGTTEGKPQDKTEEQIKSTPSDEKVGGGESFNEFADRIHKAWDETKKESKDQTVQFTHSSVMKMIEAGEEHGWDNKDDQLRKSYNEKTEPAVGEKKSYKTANGEIHLLRHAESEDGANNLTRTKDTPLTDKGKEEAATVIPEALKEEGIKPSEIVSDNQPRTAETAEIVHKELSTTKPEENASPQSIEKPKEVDIAPPQPDKPLHQMSSEELDSYYNELRNFNKNLDKQILGSKHKEYNSAQGILNSVLASKESRIVANKTISDIEKSLSEKQLALLHGDNLHIGDINNEEQVRDYRDKVDYIESANSENELAKYISQSLIDLNDAPHSIGEMSEHQKMAVAAMNAAKRVIEERGYNGRNITQEALKVAANKFSDERDAELMLSKYLNIGEQPPREPNTARSVAPEAPSKGQTSETKEEEKVISEPAEGEEKATKAKGSNSDIAGKKKEELTFKTSKGSEYILHEDGTTTRNKAPRNEPGHEGQQGEQPRSEKTYFVTKDDLNKLDLVQTSGWKEGETPTIADLKDGKIAVGVTGGERHGQFIGKTKVEYHAEPKEGLYPLEVWDNGTKHHFGNEITEVKTNSEPNQERSVAPAAKKEEQTPAQRLSQIDLNLKMQRASQIHEGNLRSKAEKENDIPSANKHNENWYKKQDRIDKLEEQRKEVLKEQKEAEYEQVKESYNKLADRIEKRYEKNKKEHEGAAYSSILGLSHKIGDHIADFVVARVVEGVRQIGNIDVAIRRAIRLAKEKFGDEAKELSLDDIDKIKEATQEYQKPLPNEPILPVDHEEYAKDILADVLSGKMTHEEAKKEIWDEVIENREGKPVSDAVSENAKAKILNYLDWHIQNDITSIKNATTRLRREQFGLNEEIPAAKKEFGETWDEAKNKIENNPQTPLNLIEELSKKARPLTDVENAILLHHQNTKEIELQNINDNINKAADENDQGAIIENKVSKSRVLDELQQIYDINKAVGTENARGLASRRMMVDRKYSLVNMIAEKRATANEGKALSEEQQADIEKLHSKIKETQDAFDNYIKESESKIIDLQRKALSGPLQNKKTASKKLHEWADRIRNASKNQAYSSPIPITPHMVADAIDLIASGVAKGEKLVNLIKQAINKASKDYPGIDENDLEKEINKELIDSGILEPSKAKKSANDMSGLFADGKLDREALRLKVEADRAKAQYDINLKRDKEKQLSKTAKFQNWFIKWQRAFKLSNPLTMGKLMMAGITRLTTTPLEDIVGGAYSAVLPQLAKGAIGEGGGLNVAETAKAYKDGLLRGLKDAKEILSKKSQGKSELDVLFGKAGELPPEAIDFFGQLHSATKAPIKRAIFERSLERRLRRNAANGVDITDPMVQTSILVDAYKDSNRAIFMQDNKVAEGWQKLVKHFDQVDPSTGKAPHKIIASTLQWMMPFVKVPTNIAAEIGTHVYGAPVAAYKLIHAAFTDKIENLPADEKEIILRNLKKGSLGIAALALGYFNPQNFGGFYQPGQKRDEDDAEALGLKIFGRKIPSWFVEAPIYQAMQLGATVRRVKDKVVKGEEQGIGEGLWAGLIGLVNDIPMASQPMRIGKMIANTRERNYYLGELAKSTVDPALVTYFAKVTDPADEGNPIRKALAPENKRATPKTIGEHIKSGIPFLREGLDEKGGEHKSHEVYR